MYSEEDHSYHSHYSEENIYKLAYKYSNQTFEDGEAHVIDLDSTLGYRVPFAKYMKDTFHPDAPLANRDHDQLFRVVPADLFLDYFASDRSHMVSSYPNYKQKPPAWPTIKGHKAETEMNVENYISMEEQEAEYYGKVMTLRDFMEMGMGQQ
eukprot:gene11195-13033_t